MKRLRQLQGSTDGRQYFAVTPLLNYYNLGLEAVDVLLEVPDYSSILKLEELARAHPYTAYRCRCYGSINGLFLQFRVPMGTTSLVREVIERLQKRSVVKNARFLEASNIPTIYSSLRIDGWDPNTMSWQFDWHKWFNTMPQKSTPLERKRSEVGEALRSLTKKDLEILYELMNTARRKNKEIIDALAARQIHITPQTFSRRLQFIKEKCIEGFRVTFDPAAFDIYSNVIIMGRGEPTYLQDLTYKMTESPIPFESTMRVSDRELFWFVRLQPTHLTPLLTELFAQLHKMDVCIADYTHSCVYRIWPATLDEEAKSWRTDRQTMVDNVLRDIGVE